LIGRHSLTTLWGVSDQPSEEVLRSSLEALGEALFRMTAVRDETGRVVDFTYEYCNRAALEVLGRRREDVLGRRLLELFPSHRTNGLFEAYARVTDTGKPLRYEFSFDEGGVVGEFEIVVTRAGDGYVLAGHDISDRKRRERQHAAVEDQLSADLVAAHLRLADDHDRGLISDDELAEARALLLRRGQRTITLPREDDARLGDGRAAAR
jgi:PAS domain S-box-containing protein